MTAEDGNNALTVWDVRRRREARELLGHTAAVTAAAFSSDTGDDRGMVRTMDACSGCLDPAALIAVARRRVTRSLTPVERATFLGGGG